MPDANNGPVTTAPDTVVPPVVADDPFEGFSAAMVGNADPEAPPSDPAEAKAVETSATVETPAVETTAETPVATPDPTPPAKPVNFDGFSDAQKATWERLLKAGYATPEEVEASRKDSLRQDAWSKKTAALAREREKFEAERATEKEDLALLAKIRSDEKLHAAWLKASKGELPADDAAADELVDKRGAKAVARETYREESAAEKAAASAKDKALSDHQAAVREMVQEQIRLLAVSPEMMEAYLKAEEPLLLARGKNTILDITPQELQERIVERHEKAVLAAKVASLTEQLTKRTSNESRTAKQSLPPARRVAVPADDSPLSQTEADLNLAPDWSNVQGMGHRT